MARDSTSDRERKERMKEKLRKERKKDTEK